MKGLTEQLENSSDQPDLTPMIDVVFLLLLFFIVTTTFSEESNLFKVDLPTAKFSQVKSVDDVTIINIAKNGQIAIGQKVIADDKLYTILNKKNTKRPIKTLIIQGDKKSPYEKVVLTMDIAQGLGISDVSFAVIKK